jgi:hypothetical protein
MNVVSLNLSSFKSKDWPCDRAPDSKTWIAWNAYEGKEQGGAREDAEERRVSWTVPLSGRAWSHASAITGATVATGTGCRNGSGPRWQSWQQWPEL